MAGNNIPRPGQAGPADAAPVAPPKKWKPSAYGPSVNTWACGCSTGTLQNFSCYTTGAVYDAGSRKYITPPELPGLKEEILADIKAAEVKYETFMFAVLTENQPHWEVIREVLLERGWKEICHFHNMGYEHAADKYRCRIFNWVRPSAQAEWQI